MADAKYDAVLIGGGNKCLALAMYLAKYGGMKVGIFESRHELGGGWGSAELPLPGFLHDIYSSTHVGDYYHGPLWEDFPDWEEKGAKYIAPRVAKGCIFKEDHSCLVIYNEKADPNQEQTAREIARFSERDAETWLRWWKLWKGIIEPEYMKDLWNPAPPLGTPTNLDKVLASPGVAIDPIWKIYPGEQFFDDCFDSAEVKNYCLKAMRGHSGQPPDYPTGGFALFLTSLAFTKYGFIKGGGHQLAHASIRIIIENGGEFFTHSEVDRVIIENGQARGIRLVDGTEIEATKAVISGLDPATLCFRLIGEEYLSSQICRRVRHLVHNLGTLCWNAWATHEPARYKAADWNPDLNEAFSINLIDKDMSQLSREYAWRRLGKFPPPEDSPTLFICQSMFDETRAPEGKHKYTSETFVLPAYALSEKEWLEYKKQKPIVEQAIWQEYAPNMTWDKIIDCYIHSPYDTLQLANFAPSGSDMIIDAVPHQVGSCRPIPELAQHRTPVKNLYATGSAWPPRGCAASWQGYNCYKIMAEDYGLRKPWDEKGRPY